MEYNMDSGTPRDNSMAVAVMNILFIIFRFSANSMHTMHSTLQIFINIGIPRSIYYVCVCISLSMYVLVYPIGLLSKVSLYPPQIDIQYMYKYNLHNF